MNTGRKTHQPNHQPELHVHHVYYRNHDHHRNWRQQERLGQQQQQQAQRFSSPKRALEQSSGKDDRLGKEKGQQLGQGQGQQDRLENWGRQQRRQQ
jgi:hypothetical protein